ncbi:Uncharacterised protein [Mycolicibacterium flavescens]|nr:Uncharacterised protein [Mycolicibacterium flavescens]
MPSTTEVDMGTVTDNGRGFDITDFRADLPEGFIVNAPHLTIRTR